MPVTSGVVPGLLVGSIHPPRRIERPMTSTAVHPRRDGVVVHATVQPLQPTAAPGGRLAGVERPRHGLGRPSRSIAVRGGRCAGARPRPSASRSSAMSCCRSRAACAEASRSFGSSTAWACAIRSSRQGPGGVRTAPCGRVDASRSRGVSRSPGRTRCPRGRACGPSRSRPRRWGRGGHWRPARPGGRPRHRSVPCGPRARPRRQP